jgi:hypothetical protein
VDREYIRLKPNKGGIDDDPAQAKKVSVCFEYGKGSKHLMGFSKIAVILYPYMDFFKEEPTQRS